MRSKAPEKWIVRTTIFRQYYLYATDPKIKRIGMQCWIYLAVCALEAAICVKFGREILPPMKMTFVAMWCVMLVSRWLFTQPTGDSF